MLPGPLFANGVIEPRSLVLEVAAALVELDEVFGGWIKHGEQILSCVAGGQISHIFCRPQVFVSTPLTLISTWDGDELSAAVFFGNSTLPRNANKQELQHN